MTTAATFTARTSPAARTIRHAVAAEIRLAAFARACVFVIGRRATVDAFDADPILDPNVGARGVVSLEDLPHEQEEIKQPPFFECGANGRLALSLAERFVADMRMGDARVTRRLVRIDGFEEIGTILAEPGPAQDDPEPSESQPFQLNRIGHHPKPLFPKIEFDLVELRSQSREILDERSKGCARGTVRIA